MDKSYLTRGINGLFIIGAIMVGAPMSVQAASFDCAKASTNVEKMICADAEISALDEALAKAYTVVLEKAVNKQALKNQQKSWLKKERNTCESTECLMNVYSNRINVLTGSDIHKQKIQLVKFKDETLCKGVQAILEENLLDENNQIQSLVDWKPLHASFKRSDGLLMPAFIFHPHYIVRDYDNNGTLDTIVRETMEDKFYKQSHIVQILNIEYLDKLAYLSKEIIESTKILSRNFNSRLTLWGKGTEVGFVWIDIVDFSGKTYFLLIPNEYDNNGLDNKDGDILFSLFIFDEYQSSKNGIREVLQIKNMCLYKTDEKIKSTYNRGREE